MIWYPIPISPPANSKSTIRSTPNWRTLVTRRVRRCLRSYTFDNEYGDLLLLWLIDLTLAQKGVGVIDLSRLNWVVWIRIPDSTKTSSLSSGYMTIKLKQFQSEISRTIKNYLSKLEKKGLWIDVVYVLQTNANKSIRNDMLLVACFGQGYMLKLEIPFSKIYNSCTNIQGVKTLLHFSMRWLRIKTE